MSDKVLFFVNILKRKHLRLIYHVPNGKQSLKKFVAVLAISYLKKTTLQAPSSKTASNTIYKFDLFYWLMINKDAVKS